MTPMHTHATDWLRLVQAEYEEMPGLNLTKPQVQRLWGIDEVTCNEVLGTLEAERFLKRTPRDGYILADEPS
jgi:DNA-binding GntR family transcriptional regulator